MNVSLKLKKVSAFSMKLKARESNAFQSQLTSTIQEHGVLRIVA